MGLFNFFKKQKDESLAQTFNSNNYVIDNLRFVSNEPTVAWITTQDGNITLTIDGDGYSIGQDHINHGRIVDALRDGDYYNLKTLIDAAAAVEQVGGVTVKGGQVFYQGQPTHSVIAKRIVQFMREGHAYEPLMLFLDNLMQNPSARSVEELYSFLENEGMPITDDGCFVGYKGINENWTDCWSGKFDNSVGKTIEMPRNKVDDNSSRTCSYGFHVGSHSYAQNWSRGHVVLVKVNPADAVSVPAEHGAEKLRVCRYEVIAECEALLTGARYETAPAASEEPDDFEHQDEGFGYEEDEFCPVCGDDGCFDEECTEEDNTPF